MGQCPFLFWCGLGGFIMDERRGWLEKQIESVEKKVNAWPDWLRRAAGVETERDPPIKQPAESVKNSDSLQCRFTFRLKEHTE